MSILKFLALLSFTTLISCGDQNVEKHYENEKIKVIYKENKNLLSTQSINLSLAPKDTILKSKRYTFKTINNLLNSTLTINNEKLNFINSDTYDVIITKKDSLLSKESLYQEFKIFLKKERIIE